MGKYVYLEDDEINAIKDYCDSYDMLPLSCKEMEELGDKLSQKPKIMEKLDWVLFEPFSNEDHKTYKYKGKQDCYIHFDIYNHRIDLSEADKLLRDEELEAILNTARELFSNKCENCGKTNYEGSDICEECEK